MSKKLDIKESIIYDSFNKLRLEKPGKTKIEEVKKNWFSSEELAIWHILQEPKSIDYLRENIVFKEAIWEDLRQFLENKDILDSLNLEKRDKYKSIALMLEEEDKLKTEENLWTTLEKLVRKINLNAYKKLVQKLKSQMDNWDNDAFAKYSEIIRTAKKYSLK